MFCIAVGCVALRSVLSRSARLAVCANRIVSWLAFIRRVAAIASAPVCAITCLCVSLCIISPWCESCASPRRLSFVSRQRTINESRVSSVSARRRPAAHAYRTEKKSRGRARCARVRGVSGRRATGAYTVRPSCEWSRALRHCVRLASRLVAVWATPVCVSVDRHA